MASLYPDHDQAGEDNLFVAEESADCVTVDYEPSAAKIEAACQMRGKDKSGKGFRRRLLRVDGQNDRMTIYPINTRPYHTEFLEPKYRQVLSITVEGFDCERPKTRDDIQGILFDTLPSSFVKNYEYGLGLKRDYRFIIEAIEEVPGIEHLLISETKPTSMSTDTYTLNYGDYEAIRKGIDRITANCQDRGRVDKTILSHNSLLHTLDPDHYPEKSRPYKKDTIFKFISSVGDHGTSLSKADQKAAVNLIAKNKRPIYEKQRSDMLRLKDDIELINLESLIAEYKRLLTGKVGEARWQQLLNSNPFIISLAFGYPVTKMNDQAFVGGKRLSGTGAKIADFLVKNCLTNNAALVEIKKPSTKLLQKREYRGGVFGPSAELSSAINQVLDQKYNFQKEIAAIKDNSGVPDLESYCVHCVLITGRTPSEKAQRKSFELYRGNSKDVLIVTFDELLGKLENIYAFLSSE